MSPVIYESVAHTLDTRWIRCVVVVMYDGLTPPLTLTLTLTLALTLTPTLTLALTLTHTLTLTLALTQT